MLVSTANRLFTLLVTSRAFLRLFLSYPPPTATLPKCTTYLIYTLKQEVQRYSRHRNNSYLPKLLARLTNANTSLLRHRRNWYPILTCRIGTNDYFLNRRIVFLSKNVIRSHDRPSRHNSLSNDLIYMPRLLSTTYR